MTMKKVLDVKLDGVEMDGCYGNNLCRFEI